MRPTARHATRTVLNNVATAFSEACHHDDGVLNFVDVTVERWNDILENLRRQSKACGGGLLNLIETRAPADGDGVVGAALFVICDGVEEHYIGALWREGEQSCALYDHVGTFPAPLRDLLTTHAARRSGGTP